MPDAPTLGLLRRTWLNLQSSALRRIDAHGRRRSRLPPHLRTGLDGEREALFYLRRMGYIVVARRWRSPLYHGDLDLIAWHGDTLCFVEIKTRASRDLVPAESAVDHDKQRVLRALARHYLRRLPSSSPPPPARFDVLSLYLHPGDPLRAPDIALLPGAFPWK